MMRDKRGRKGEGDVPKEQSDLTKLKLKTCPPFLSSSCVLCAVCCVLCCVGCVWVFLFLWFLSFRREEEEVWMKR